MIENEIIEKMRLCFGIPDEEPMAWGIIEESHDAFTESLRPALLLEDGKLALDILQRRFYTSSQVLSFSRKLHPAHCDAADETIVLSSDDNYRCELTMQEVWETLFVSRYNDELVQRVRAGGRVL